MEIAKIVGGELAQYPVSPAEVEAAVIAAQTTPGPFYFRVTDNFAGVDLPEGSFVVVQPTEPPATDIGEVAERDGIEFSGGVWRWKWAVRLGTAAELERAKLEKLDILRDLRWQKSEGGTVINGMPIRTDDASQGKIDRAVALFEKHPALATVDFEAMPNVWAAFDQPTMVAIGVAVGLHVQQCFAWQKLLYDQIIAAETFADLASIDIETGWPA